ncbi:MAG TPA: hypothetical protein DCO77_13910 [Nitrospiraceae bacterium]|nr:hypothetical protein [Nitrospiraceae bacterium]
MKKNNLLIIIAVTSLFTVAGMGSTSVLAASGEQGSTNGKPFQTLQAKIDLLSIDLAEAVSLLQTQIDTLISEQADQDTLITALQSAVATLEARVSQNEVDIDVLQAIQSIQAQLINALDARVNDLEARVAANEDDIASLVLADQALHDMIIAIQNQIGTINARITANDGDIAVLQSQVAQLQANLNSVQLQLAAKQNRVNGICAAGFSIRQIFSNGSVTCERDDISAGVGTLSTYRSSDSVTIPSSVWTVQYVSNYRSCTGTNYRAVGGGYSISDGNYLGPFGHVYRDRPYSNYTWQSSVRADSTGERTLTTYVVCARVQ